MPVLCRSLNSYRCPRSTISDLVPKDATTPANGVAPLSLPQVEWGDVAKRLSESLRRHGLVNQIDECGDYEIWIITGDTSLKTEETQPSANEWRFELVSHIL